VVDAAAGLVGVGQQRAEPRTREQQDGRLRRRVERGGGGDGEADAGDLVGRGAQTPEATSGAGWRPREDLKIR
jgi:hypothetical protein